MRSNRLFLLSTFALVAVIAGGVWLSRRPPTGQKVEAPQILPPPHSLTKSTPEVDPEELKARASLASPAVQVVVDAGKPYDERLAAIKSIVTNPSEADWEALRGYLLKKSPESNQSELAYRNQLLNTLGALNPPSPEFGETLIDMTRSGNLDKVMRDYALQDLAAYYEEISAAHGSNSQTEQSIRDVLWDGLSETDSSIAGTSLLALERLSQGRSEFDQDKIAAAALELANDQNVGELTRITAFQVCAKMNVGDALPAVFRVAQNGETIPLQMSAISALGAIGGQDQVPFLRSLMTGAEDRLKLPAQHALNQIAARAKRK